MIIYDAKKAWATIFAAPGPYLIKALQAAVPAGVLAWIWGHIYQHELVGGDFDFGDVNGVTNGYTMVLGFLIVFRAQLAYGRFWDGASFLQTIKSGWFNATTSMFAFCTKKEDRQEEVLRFQHQLVRLMSLMYGSALELVAGQEGIPDLQVLDYDGIDPYYMNWVLAQHDKLEITMSWMQRLIVEAHRANVIDIAPPILSRVFQELSNGIVLASDAKRINKFPFPFPYAQMIWIMLVAHWVMVIFMSGVARSPPVAFFYAFCTVFALWGITWIAIEIEMPFGTDKNDLPMVSMQKSMNDCLALLLHPNCQALPKMCPIESKHLSVGVKHPRISGPDHIRDTATIDQSISKKGESGEVRYFLGKGLTERVESLGTNIFDSPAKAAKPTPQITEMTPQKQIVELKQTPESLPKKQGDDIAPLKEIVRTLEKHFEALVQVHNNSKAFAEELKHLRRNNEQEAQIASQNVVEELKSLRNIIEQPQTYCAGRKDNAERVCSGNLLGACSKGPLSSHGDSSITSGLRVA